MTNKQGLFYELCEGTWVVQLPDQSFDHDGLTEDGDITYDYSSLEPLAVWLNENRIEYYFEFEPTHCRIDKGFCYGAPMFQFPDEDDAALFHLRWNGARK